MICPVCRSDMIVVEHHNIELDYCTDCRGVWFDSGELELLVEASGLDSPLPFLDAVFNSGEVSSKEKKRKCPICSRKMKKVHIDKEGRILVDICNEEHGIWFDGGEVEHLLKSISAESAEKSGSGQDVMKFLGEVFQSET